MTATTSYENDKTTDYRTSYEESNDKASNNGKGYESMESDDDNQESDDIEVSIIGSGKDGGRG